MQIEVKLRSSSDILLSFDYYYELSAALYHALSEENSALAMNLHDGLHNSRIKMFVFSPLSSSPSPKVSSLANGVRALKFGSRLWMRIGSIWPEVIYSLSEALQKQKKIVIRGQIFTLEGIQMVNTPNFSPVMTYRCFGQSGSIVCAFEKDGKKRYQMPDDSEKDIPSCSHLILENIRHKLLRLKDIRSDILDNILSPENLTSECINSLPIKIEFLPLKDGVTFKTRLHNIKGTVVRSFRSPVRISAPEAVQRIVWNCGIGNLNSQGFGLMELGRN